MKTKLKIILITIILITIAFNSFSRVKFVTLPERSKVILNLENPSDSLVMEERIITLQQGLNEIDFSWQGVNINADSIQFEPITNTDKISVLSVSYPPNENALTWKVSSGFSGEANVRIYYLLWGLDRTMSYKAQVSNDEKSAILKSYFKLSNNSGEDFEDANITTGFGNAWIKSIQNSESKEMLSFSVDALPVQKRFIYDSQTDPEKTYMYYEIKNDKENKLGDFLLKEGKARLFQTDNSGASIFLGEDYIKQTPVNEKSLLYLGVARDIVIKRNVMKDEKINLRWNNTKNQVVLYDREIQVKFEVENFKNVAENVKIVEHLSDYWVVEESTDKYEKKDANTLEITSQIPPKGKKKTITLVYKMLNQMD